MNQASLLPVGTGSFDLTAGISDSFGGGLDAFVRGELGWHPTDRLTGFAFAQADRVGVQAGLGIRGTF